MGQSPYVVDFDLIWTYPDPVTTIEVLYRVAETNRLILESRRPEAEVRDWLRMHDPDILLHVAEIRPGRDGT